MYESLRLPPPRSAIGTRTMKTAIAARPARTTGDSGWRRRQPSRSVTARRPAPRRARRAGRGARAASSRCEPGDARVARCRGGVHAHRREAERALERPGGHVDELHPPVRDHRHAEEEDAAADEQVVLALGIAPGAHAPRRRRPRRPPRARARQRRRSPRPRRSATTSSAKSPAESRSATTPTSSRRNVSRRGEGARHAVSGSSIAHGVLPQ